MLTTILFQLDFFIEDLLIQILLLSTTLFIITTHSLVRKLWGFGLIIIILGLLLALLGYELFISFLWLIEVSFIIVFLLLILSFNSSLKTASNTVLTSNLKHYLLTILLLGLLLVISPVYLYLTNYYTKVGSDLTTQSLTANNYLTDYYKENQGNGIILSDLKGLGYDLFNLNSVSLLTFLVLLTIASILIVIMQLQASLKKNFNNTLVKSLLIINRLKYNTSKGYMNKEILEYQLKMRNGLRTISVNSK